MSSFDKRATGFDRIVPSDARIEHIACGFTFTEGPLWDGDSLLFSDIPNSRIARWRRLPEGPELTTFRSPSQLSNGLTFDRQGRLLACEGNARRLTRTETDGTIVTIAETYQGKRINSPNDVVAAPDGSIYFTDPFWAQSFKNPFGPTVQNEDRELPFDGVYRVGLDGIVTLLIDDFIRPNGLAFSPDGHTLYVADTRKFHMRAFDVGADGGLSNGRIFAEIESEDEGVPDGMKVDIEGNVYCTGPGGVWVVAASGEILGRILPPEVPANVCWGDSDMSTLYITARTSVYRVKLAIPGMPVM